MLDTGNRDVESAEVTLERFLGFLVVHKDKRLAFHADGHAVKPGYHITEVKAGHFNAMDCEGNPESWEEMFVQLWNVGEQGEHMSAAKFSAIIRKVSERVKVDHAAKLTFELSDGTRPIQLYQAISPEISGNAIHVSLVAQPASCKPRDRWLKTQSACCPPSTQAQACCG
jgi:Family of unknown function (DUF6428)